MIKTFFRVFLSVGVFGVVHSLLASRPVKARAAALLGTDNRNGLYRFFYLFQSVVTLAILLGDLARIPDRTLYRLRGLPAWVLRLGQAGGLVFATITAYQVGFDRILGIRSFLDWLEKKQSARRRGQRGRGRRGRDKRDVYSTPEAQGPSPKEKGRGLNAAGPFRITRHPLNLAPLPVFWLTPHLTVKRLAFNLAGTLYLILGSMHEEARLRAAYGRDYRRYQRSGVPFYLPNP